MATALIYHDRFLEHDTRAGHPERPDRLRALMKGLDDAGLLETLVRPDFAPAERAYLERLHQPEYIQRCFDHCRGDAPFIDTPDSAICPASAEIAQLAAGGVLEATRQVMDGRVDNAFCAVRPPGHHAEARLSMGFCLFANVALAADYLTRELGLERAAVLDFDVHHGNGTQHLLEERSDILVISLHEDPAVQYPGTGYAHETGTGEGEGFTLNIPLASGSGDDVYQHAFEAQVLPGLNDFRPQCLLISAGFDAAVEDPLGGMNVTTDGFAWMSRRLVEIAREHCGGRLVSVLEGGYDLDALSKGVAAHIKTLIEAGG